MEFQTSHSISKEAFKQRRDDLHQSMRSKEKPELNEKLGELIAADIKNNIEAKRLSEYERYDVEPLTTTEKPVLTTQAMVAKSINEGLIDDFSILEEAGSENKQTSRIQIKKGSLTKLLHNKKTYPWSLPTRPVHKLLITTFPIFTRLENANTQSYLQSWK